MSWGRRCAAAAAGLAVDAVAGEPPAPVHPVAAFGQAMGGLERRWWRDARAPGVAYAAAGVSVGAVAGWAVRSTALATALAVAGNALARAALGVETALVAGDLDEARRRLPALVGRDVGGLDARGVSRAAVESVAENLVDAVVAPALWAAAGGAPGVLAYRAANTLDAMVGHRDQRHERFGWASARVDDLANWVPARVTASLVAAARPARAVHVWRCVRRDASAHPSPNAGVAEAAFAGALGLRLGGPLSYGGRGVVSPFLGEGRMPEPADIGRAVRLARTSTLLLASTLAVLGLEERRRRRGRGR